MGFSSTKNSFDPASVLSEVEKVFRREFINRIDRVVVFRSAQPRRDARHFAEGA